MQKEKKNLFLKAKFSIGLYFKKVCQIVLIFLRFEVVLLFSLIKKNKFFLDHFFNNIFFFKKALKKSLLIQTTLKHRDSTSFIQPFKSITEQQLVQKIYLLRNKEIMGGLNGVNQLPMDILQKNLSGKLLSEITVLKFSARVKQQNTTYYNYFCLFYNPFFQKQNFSNEILHSMDFLSFNLFGTSFFFDFYIDKKFETGKFSFFNYFDQNNTSVNNLNYFLTKSTNVNVETIFLFLQTLYIKNNFSKHFEFLEINYFNQKYLSVLNTLLLSGNSNKQVFLSRSKIVSNVTQQLTFIPYFGQIKRLVKKNHYLFFYVCILVFIYRVFFFNGLELFFCFFYIVGLGGLLFLSRYLLKSYVRILSGGKEQQTKLEIEQFFLKSYTFTQYDDFIFFQQEFFSLARQQNFEKEADIKASWEFMQNTLSGTNTFAQPFTDIAFLEKHFFYLYQLTILDYFDSYYNTHEDLEYKANLTLHDDELLYNYLEHTDSDFKNDEPDLNGLKFHIIDSENNMLPTFISSELLYHEKRDPLEEHLFWTYLIEDNNSIQINSYYEKTGGADVEVDVEVDVEADEKTGGEYGDTEEDDDFIRVTPYVFTMAGPRKVLHSYKKVFLDINPLGYVDHFNYLQHRGQEGLVSENGQKDFFFFFFGFSFRIFKRKFNFFVFVFF